MAYSYAPCLTSPRTSRNSAVQPGTGQAKLEAARVASSSTITVGLLHPASQDGERPWASLQPDAD